MYTPTHNIFIHIYITIDNHIYIYKTLIYKHISSTKGP